MVRPVCLTSLPVVCIVRVFAHCSGGRDLLNTAAAFGHPKAWEAVEERSLWREAVIGPEHPRRFAKYLGPHTTALTIRGFVRLGAKTLRPVRASWEPAEQLTAAVVEAVRLRCPALASLTLHSCAIDVTRVRLSLFPRSLLHLHLHSCALVNQGDPSSQAATSSPFHNIKRHLPLLATLAFTRAAFLRPADNTAVLAGCRVEVALEVAEEGRVYTFTEGELGRGGRRNKGKQFRDLLDFHHTKRSHNTRALPPV